MPALTEYMVADARRRRGSAAYGSLSTSLGPVVVLRGWREGVSKAGVTLLLRAHGVPLPEASNATDAVFDGRPIAVRLSAGIDIEAVRRSLSDIGIVV
jgi:hypothetical protein